MGTELGGVIVGHPVLLREASGLRHLRWGREVLGTLRGFAALGEREGAGFSEAQREALRAEIDRVSELVAGLSGAVKPYRDFLERRRTRARGAVRAAAFLCGGGAGASVTSRGALEGRGAQGSSAAIAGSAERRAQEGTWAQGPSAALAGSVDRRALHEAAVSELEGVIEAEREALRGALGRAIEELRAGLAAMDERLAKVCSAEMVAALYPELAADGMRVLDDGDRDDDAAAGPTAGA